MTVGMDVEKASTEHATKESQVAGSLRFDWIMIAVCTWLVSGLYAEE